MPLNICYYLFSFCVSLLSSSFPFFLCVCLLLFGSALRLSTEQSLVHPISRVIKKITTMLSLLNTYAPSVALWILVFLIVRGLLWAIWSTLIRPSKNVKKYVRDTTHAHPAEHAPHDTHARTSHRRKDIQNSISHVSC